VKYVIRKNISSNYTGQHYCIIMLNVIGSIQRSQCQS